MDATDVVDVFWSEAAAERSGASLGACLGIGCSRQWFRLPAAVRATPTIEVAAAALASMSL